MFSILYTMSDTMSDTNTDSQKLANITIKNRERQARYYLKHKQGILDKMKNSREQLKELNAIPEPEFLPNLRWI